MIKFNIVDCTAMLQTSVQLITPVSVEILKQLPEGLVLHATKQLGAPTLFHDINDKKTTCVGVVSKQYLDILNNVLISSATIFHHYELILSSLFPDPACPKMEFNIPPDYFSAYFVTFPKNSQKLCYNTHDMCTVGSQ